MKTKSIEKNTKKQELNKKNKLKRFGGTRPIPKNVQETIPYVNCYDNGVMELENGEFSKLFKYKDISFKTKSEDEQETIYNSYQKFLNSINPDENICFYFVNAVEDEKLKLESIAPIMKGDKYDKYRKETKDMLASKMKDSRNNITTKKYISLKTKSTSVDDAMQRLAGVGSEISNNFRKITEEPLTPINLSERLEIMHSIMDSKEKNYWFEHDKKGNAHVDFNKMAKRGYSTKDIIAPEFLQFNSSDFMINGKYGQALYLDGIANWMNASFIPDLCAINFESTIAINIESLPQQDALKKIRTQSININSNVIERTKHLQKNGVGGDPSLYISTDLKNAQEQIETLQTDLINRDQKLFFMTLTMIHFADTKEELKRHTSEIKNLASKYMSTIKPLFGQQERGFVTCLPLGLNKIYGQRLLTTESLAIFSPFDEISMFDEGGIYYGINEINKSLIVKDRMKGQNYNGLILGASGSGKSFAAKREMTTVILNRDVNTYIVDPDGEYTPLAKAFGGEVITLAPGQPVYINPFDLDIDTKGQKGYSPIAMKTDFIYGMVETMMGRNGELTPTQKAILDRCIKMIYRPYLERLAERSKRESTPVTIDRQLCPTLQNLFDTLLSQPEIEAQNLALNIEPYVTGTFDIFAHKTNVDVENRLIIYNIQNLGETLTTLALRVCMNEIWNKMVANRRQNKWTWFYIDEFHLLLSNETTANFLKTVWKRARKFQGVPTGITQNVEELLSSPAARTIINNTAFVYLLNQSAMDRNMLAEILHLSEHDVEYLTNADIGHGLISTGDQVAPFADEFPENTELFKIMTTKPEES